VAEVSITDLGTHASQIIARVQRGTPFVVTTHGQAMAVLLSVHDAEDMVLANAAEFAKRRRRARADYVAGRATPLATPD